MSSSENKETIITGDLNCDYLKSSDHPVLKDIIKLNGFKQIISSPTRTTIKSQTLIDIVITNDKSRIANSIVYANSFSDHDLIGVIRKMHIKKYLPRTIFTRNYSKYDKECFKNDLRNIPWENCILQHDVNAAWNLFKDYVTTAVENHAPLVE